ncbi:MAG: glycosyltransferase family 4 protein [Candidatus Limnocylindria bacterium]
MSDRYRRRLKIAYVYDALYPHLMGGAERRFHELAQRLADRHDVHYITWTFWDGPSETTRDGVVLHGVGTPERMYGADGKRTVREAISFAARIMPAIRGGRYDVIDCSATPYVPLYSCWLAARTTRTPVVATWHEFWGEHWEEYLGHRGKVARVARSTEARAIRLGDRQVAVSAFTADRLTDAGLPEERIQIVGNGLPLEEFEAAHSSLVTSDVVFVGRLIEDKRVDLLIDAVASLRAEFPTLRCLVIGDGPERPRLEAQVAALGLGQQVWFLGHVIEAEKLCLLKASRILVLPSVREGFGIAAVEGQAAGLVPIVIRSPFSAAPGLIRDGVDGLVCDPTVDALAAAVRSLLADQFRMHLMRTEATAAAKRWDWDRVALEMERVYLDVARPEESPRAHLRRLSWR